MNIQSIKKLLISNIKKIVILFELILELKIIPIFLFLIFLCYHIFRIPLSLAGVDSGYFLPIARDLYTDGLIPLRDIHTAYTPLAYWIYAIPFSLFDDVTIIYFYFLNLVLVLLSTLLFYLVIKKLNFKHHSWILLVFFLNASYLIYDIKLELVALIPAILAFLFISKYLQTLKFINLFIAGLFIGAAVLTKQYALILAPMAILISFADTINKDLKPFRIFFLIIMAISSGLISVLIGFIFVYSILNQVNVNFLLTQFLGNSIYDCMDSYGHRSILKIFSGLKYYLTFMPFVFLTPMLLLTKITESEKKLIIHLILLILISLFPFYFQIFPHYFFFGFVPVLIWGLKVIHNSRFRLFLTIGFMFPVIHNLYSIYALSRDYSLIQSKKNFELEFYSNICEKIPSGAPAYIIGKNQIYFECKLKSLDEKNLSYSFVPPNCIANFLSTTNRRPNSFYYIGPSNKISFQNYKSDIIHITKSVNNYKKYYIIKFYQH